MKETADKQRGRPFKKGESGNKNGRPKGQRNYATIYRAALEKYATEKDMTADQLEEEIEQKGLEQALKGDYKFFQDFKDRIHGKPQQSIDHTTDGEKIEGITVKMIDATGN